jgi:hypothetical protein
MRFTTRFPSSFIKFKYRTPEAATIQNRRFYSSSLLAKGSADKESNMSTFKEKMKENKEIYSSLRGGLFGDERDEIAAKIIADGGSEAFVKENLRSQRYKYTHDPRPYSKDVTAPQESPFVSDPLGERMEKKVRCRGTIFHNGFDSVFSCLSQLALVSGLDVGFYHWMWTSWSRNCVLNP